MSTLAGGSLAHAVTDGPLVVAAGVAVLVGVVGFLSPCVLPLVPGYLSYVAGLSGDSADRAASGAGALGSGGASGAGASGSGGTRGGTALATRPNQRRMVAGALLFVAGFTTIFVLQGFAFGALAGSITAHRAALEQVLGVVTIGLGVVFLGGVGFAQREIKVHRLPRAGLLGAPLLGATFGLAWTPCATPTLGAVLSLASTQGTAGRGALLTAFYCLGLGLPFVLVALGVGWVSGALSFVRRHRRAVSGVGGALLILIGVLLVTGEWTRLMDTLQAHVGTAGFDV